MGKPLADRFWGYVARDDSADGCWPWGRSCREGYGQMWVGGRLVPVTHVAWFLETGEWPPKGMEACHTCDNPPCCRFSHLFLGTKATNAADRDAKGRGADQRGKHNGNAKLGEEQVRAIFRSLDSSHALARQFEVSRGAVQGIRRGRTWRGVTVG